MPLGAALVADLRTLTAGIDDDDTLQASLSTLIARLGATITSYCGLQMIVMNIGWSVTLTEFHRVAMPPTTSLSLPLRLAVPALDSGSRVVFYATNAGALVDLAADLSHVFGISMITSSSDRDRSGSPNSAQLQIELDAHLPPPSTTSGLVGVGELSTINRAVGLLIGQGHLPDEAEDQLHLGASAAGLDLYRYSELLLKR